MSLYDIGLAIQYAQAHVLRHWPVCYTKPRWTTADFPFFTDNTLWFRFLSEYGVLRYVRGCEKNRVRDALAKEWDVLLRQDGSGVDVLTEDLYTTDRNGDPTRHHSFFSKIAAFALPEHFIASDRFSRKGLKFIGKLTQEPETYKDYLGKARATLLSAELGSDISKSVAGCTPAGISEMAFKMRVLDHCLMMAGGRKAGPRGYGDDTLDADIDALQETAVG